MLRDHREQGHDQTEGSPYPVLEDVLLNKRGNISLQERFRALFTLKHLGDDHAVAIICKAFDDNSALLKHELAYVLGQMRQISALPTLESVLESCDEDPMVRHEAGEAMGAIGHQSSVPILKKYICHPIDVISETCQLALDRIANCLDEDSPDRHALLAPSTLPFASIDPAPPQQLPSCCPLSVDFLEKQLVDKSLSLYTRYKAMFALRNLGMSPPDDQLSESAVLALCRGLSDSSALFRHEVAYVLGQRQHPASVPALARALSVKEEAAMVRHECAEALGAVATPEALQILLQFINDEEDVVRESCLIALDILEHEQSDNLHYADGLFKVATLKEMKEAAS